jgi:hypothetical protein
MYTDRFSLPFICNVVIDAAERLRPGLGKWTDAVREQLRQVFAKELAEIKPRFMELFHDETYWGRLDKAVMEECFPRYCAVAERQSKVEQAGYHVWRGGDLVARGALALGGMLTGVGLVYLPFIPIPETWRFVILLTMFGAPFLPEAQEALWKRSFRKARESIISDMERAQAVDRLYEPMPAEAAAAEGAIQEVAPVTDAPPSDEVRPTPRVKER